MSTLVLTEATVINFTRQLQALLSSGIPLYKALQIIDSQATNLKYKRVLKSIMADLAEGEALSDSLTKFPESFSPFYLNMISIGENNGELETALGRVKQYLDILRENKQKISNALTYPTILLTSSALVVLLLMLFVLPKFIDIFTSAEIQLPLPTKIIFNIHLFFKSFGLPFLLTIAALIGFYLIFRKRKWFIKTADSFKLRLPLFGEISKNIYIARFCRSFGTLHSSGVNLLNSLELSMPALHNFLLLKDLQTVIKSLRGGQGLAEPFTKAKNFPPLMAQMIAVGEESGELDKLLLDIAVYYEQEADAQIKKYLSLIEPFSLMIISSLVAFIAAAIMLPLFKMATALRSF